jgi:hypothetical protein
MALISLTSLMVWSMYLDLEKRIQMCWRWVQCLKFMMRSAPDDLSTYSTCMYRGAHYPWCQLSSLSALCRLDHIHTGFCLSPAVSILIFIDCFLLCI